MSNIIKKFTMAFAALSLMLVVGVAPVSAQRDAVCEGVGLVSGQAGCGTQADAENKVGGVVRTVINLLSLVVGIAAIIMIIIGGFKYIISSGDSGNVTSAKNTILYAIIGLGVVAMAQFIVRFVLNRLG